MIKTGLLFSLILFSLNIFSQSDRCETIKKAIEFVLKNETTIDTTLDFSQLLISKKRLINEAHYVIETFVDSNFWRTDHYYISEIEFNNSLFETRSSIGDSLCDFQKTDKNWTHSIWFSDVIFNVLVIVINDFSLDEANGYGPSGNLIEYAIEIHSDESFSVIYRFTGSY
jgi:hypothetical protein